MKHLVILALFSCLPGVTLSQPYFEDQPIANSGFDMERLADFSSLETCDIGDSMGLYSGTNPLRKYVDESLRKAEDWFRAMKDLDYCDHGTLEHETSGARQDIVREYLDAIAPFFPDSGCRVELNGKIDSVRRLAEQVATHAECAPGAQPRSRYMSEGPRITGPAPNGIVLRAAEEQPRTTTHQVTARSGLVVRSDPNEGRRSERLGKLKSGKEIRIITITQGYDGYRWGKIAYPAHGRAGFGWVRMDYVAPLASSW